LPCWVVTVNAVVSAVFAATIEAEKRRIKKYFIAVERRKEATKLVLFVVVLLENKSIINYHLPYPAEHIKQLGL
jgi:hypothetical protein